MRTRRCPPRGQEPGNRGRHHRWLTAAVAALAALSAVLIFLSGGELEEGASLDSRVTCEWLGPHACELKVGAAGPAPVHRG